VSGLWGSVTGALGDIGSWLINAGSSLIDGLISGIRGSISKVGNAMSDVAKKIRGFFPGSPVKEGPLTSWNNGGAGKRLMSGLAAGLGDHREVDVAIARVANKISKAQMNFVIPGGSGPHGGKPGTGHGGGSNGSAGGGSGQAPIVINQTVNAPQGMDADQLATMSGRRIGYALGSNTMPLIQPVGSTK
jgi:hypothetical protein